MFARTITLSAVAFASLASASPSFALDNDEPRQVSVSYVGLDLTRQEGVDLLRNRLDRAVNQVCAPADSRNLREQTAADRCRTTASAAAANDMQLVVSRARARIDLASADARARKAR